MTLEGDLSEAMGRPGEEQKEERAGSRGDAWRGP